ncbi:unnamed protein product, partial [Ectocarpus sp. 4 AP-2014]
RCAIQAYILFGSNPTASLHNFFTPLNNLFYTPDRKRILTYVPHPSMRPPPYILTQYLLVLLDPCKREWNGPPEWSLTCSHAVRSPSRTPHPNRVRQKSSLPHTPPPDPNWYVARSLPSSTYIHGRLTWLPAACTLQERSSTTMEQRCIHCDTNNMLVQQCIHT